MAMIACKVAGSFHSHLVFGLFYVANLALMAMTAVFICPNEVYGMPGVWIERWRRNLTLWFLAGNEGRLELLQN